jgi:ubiquinone/menaquinone biosynthesis C-methylase UbiE
MLRRVLNLDDKSVLDLGCGIGRLSVWLAGKTALVTGMDISEEMIRVARQKAESGGAHNASFAVYDGSALPLDDGFFDIAVCCGVLKYVIDDADFSSIIKEMCRVVKPLGQVVIIDEFHNAGPVQLHGEQDIGRLSVLRRPKDYIALFQKHGMEPVDQCALYRKLFQYHAATELQKWRLGRLILARVSVTRAMATIDVWIDQVMRHRPSSARSFQMLVFVGRS